MKKIITPIFFYLATFTTQASDITMTYVNQTSDYVYMVTKGPVNPDEYAANSVLGWINPNSDGLLNADDPWFVQTGINPEKLMSVGFQDGRGNLKVCRENFYFNRSVTLTLAGGTSMADRNTYCKLTYDEVINDTLNFEFKNNSGEEIPRYLAAWIKGKGWVEITKSVQSGSSVQYYQYPLSQISPDINPNTELKFATVRAYGSESLNDPSYVVCDKQVPAAGSYIFEHKAGKCSITPSN